MKIVGMLFFILHFCKEPCDRIALQRNTNYAKIKEAKLW